MKMLGEKSINYSNIKRHASLNIHIKRMMYFEKIVATVLTISLSLLCFGCEKSQQNENALQSPEIKPYLSITETYYTDETESDMNSRCFTYDIESDKISEKGVVPYTSAYPFTLYSSDKNDIFYTAYSGKGDQIYLYNNGNAQKKTDIFSGVNYVIQCGNQYFAVAKLLEHYSTEPFIFDKKFKTPQRVFPDKKDDRITWSVSTIPQDDKVLFSYYSDKISRKCDNTKEDDSAPSDIALLDMKTKKIDVIYTTNQYVWAIAGNDKKLYFCCSPSGTSDKTENKLYEVDLSTKQSFEIKVPFYITEEMALWKNTLYCLGEQNDVRGIYTYNIKTKNTSVILKENKNEYINGFTLNY